MGNEEGSLKTDPISDPGQEPAPSLHILSKERALSSSSCNLIIYLKICPPTKINITFIVLIAAAIAESIGVPLPALRPNLRPTKESFPAPADAPVRCLQTAHVAFQQISLHVAMITVETAIFKILSSSSPSIPKSSTGWYDDTNESAMQDYLRC